MTEQRKEFSQMKISKYLLPIIVGLLVEVFTLVGMAFVLLLSQKENRFFPHSRI